MDKTDLTAERLRELLHYDPATGIFTWRRGYHATQRAGTASSDGYRLVTIDFRAYREHRVAWMYMTGMWPKNHIDHINGDKTDNRFENLRDVTRHENEQNIRRPQTNNKLGILGVRKRKDRFHAQITFAGKSVHVGSFSTAEEAHDAYLQAKRKLHPGCMI